MKKELFVHWKQETWQTEPTISLDERRWDDVMPFYIMPSAAAF